MGRKGKKADEKGSPSPQGATQASPPAPKGADPSPNSGPEVPRNEVSKDKSSKKQKSSAPKSPKEQEPGKAKNRTNGRDSSDDAKKTIKRQGKVSQGGATAKAEGRCCSLCCGVVLLSALVAVAAVGFAAYTAYPAESELLIEGLDFQLKRAVRSVDGFVRTNLEKLLNDDQKATHEQDSETRKLADGDLVESEQHLGEPSEEDEEEPDSRGERDGGTGGEFDQVEEPIFTEKTSHLEEEPVVETGEILEDREKVEPQMIVVEEEELQEVVEQKVKETQDDGDDDDDDDDDAEFEEQVGDVLRQDAGEFDDEDAVKYQEQADDRGSTKAEETAEHHEKPTDGSLEDDLGEDDLGEEQLQAEHLEENAGQKSEEAEVEDDAAEFEEQIGDDLEEDVDELNSEDDALHWEAAEDRSSSTEEDTEKRFEKSSDGAIVDDHEREESHPERGSEQFEDPQELQRVASENEKEVPEQEDTEKHPDISPVTIDQEPAAAAVPQTETVSSQEAPAEAPVEVVPSHERTEEEVHTQEVPQVPRELPEQEVPTHEVPEEVAPSQEVFTEDARAHEVPAQDVSPGEEPDVVIPSEELPHQEIPSHGEPESQIPADIHSRDDLVEKLESEAEQILSEETPPPPPSPPQPEVVEADFEVGSETVYEESIQHPDDENYSDSREEVEEVRRDAEKTDGEVSRESDVSFQDPDGVQENSDAVNAGEPPNAADAAEVELEKELDHIERLIARDPREAIEKYDRVLSVFPESPRAIMGKAKSLGALADAEQNDQILEQSIAEYLKVFSLPSVPMSLMVEAGRSCAERQTVRGWGSAAAQTLRSLVSMYPDDLILSNELGQKYLMNGAYDEAKAIFKEILSKDPNDAFALLYLGYIMKAVDREFSQSIDFMKTGLLTVHISDLRFYIELGEALTTAERHNEALEVYQLAVDRLLLNSIWQRSWFNVDGLTARPWWTPAQTDYVVNLQVLEDFRNVIREEANSILVNKSSLFLQENSDIVKSGGIRHMKLYVNGRKVVENCEAAVKTCSLLDAFTDAVNCNQCEVKFSLMQPGLHLRPHCGPTNCRLTAHFPLAVSPRARIRVAGETRTYGEDSLLMFDDSFEQELWVGDDSSELLLTVEMWHPDITTEQKSTLGPL